MSLSVCPVRSQPEATIRKPGRGAHWCPDLSLQPPECNKETSVVNLPVCGILSWQPELRPQIWGVWESMLSLICCHGRPMTRAHGTNLVPRCCSVTKVRPQSLCASSGKWRRANLIHLSGLFWASKYDRGCNTDGQS